MNRLTVSSRGRERLARRIALVAWPAIGWLTGEPLWGLAMAVFAVPLADVVPQEAAIA